MTGGPTTALQTDPANTKIEIVTHNQEPLGRQSETFLHPVNHVPRAIHERKRLDQDEATAGAVIDADPIPLEERLPKPRRSKPRNRLDDVKADVVPCAGKSRPRIPEAENNEVRNSRLLLGFFGFFVGLGAALFECGFLFFSFLYLFDLGALMCN